MSISPIVLMVDAIVVFVLLFSAFRGRKRGLVRTLTGILALLLAFWGAGILAQQTSPYLSSKYVEPWIYNSIMPSISAETESISAPPTSESTVTGSLETALEEIGLTDSLISSFFSDFAINLTDSIEQIVNSAARSIGYKLTYALLFLVYFLILYLLLRLVGKLVQLLAKIPGINFVNRTFGFILGLILGYLTILVSSYILTTTGVLLTPQIVENTYVLRFLMNFNPFAI